MNSSSPLERAMCCSLPAAPWRARLSTSSSATAGPPLMSSACPPNGTTPRSSSFPRCAKNPCAARPIQVHFCPLRRLRHRRPARQMLEEEGVERIDGPHCYAFFSGNPEFAAIADDEFTAFYLTDYLARHFDKLIWAGLGLNRHRNCSRPISETIRRSSTWPRRAMNNCGKRQAGRGAAGARL